MVALAVLLTLVICVVVDSWLSRRHRAPAPAVSSQPATEPLPHLSAPEYAGGFSLHGELAVHPGHAWVRVEGPDRVRVGIDDFARRLLGAADRIELPAVGTVLCQGKAAWRVGRGQRCAAMLAPVSGEVVAINPQLAAEPGLVAQDPYRSGWLFAVRVPEMRANLSNLLSGRLVHRWLEECASRLRSRVQGSMPLSFADGGTAVDDVGVLLDDANWSGAVREFLLTHA